MYNEKQLKERFWIRYQRQFESYNDFEKYIEKNPEVLDDFYCQLEIEYTGSRGR